MSEGAIQESGESQEAEFTMEDLQPCKWLATHNCDYANTFGMVRKAGSTDFDLGILRLVSQGRIEIVPGILGETKFMSVQPS